MSTMSTYYFILSPTCCLKYIITVWYLFLTNILHVSVQSHMFKTSTCRSIPIFKHISTFFQGLKKKKRHDFILILSLILLERIYIEWKMWDIGINRHGKSILLLGFACIMKVLQFILMGLSFEILEILYMKMCFCRRQSMASLSV